MSAESNRIFDVFSGSKSLSGFLLDNPEHFPNSHPLVVVLNPYLPEYRLKFFNRVYELLSSAGLDFLLVTGNPDKKFLARRDMSTAPFHVTSSKVSFKVLGHSIRYLHAKKWTTKAQSVVYEYSVTNLNTWLAVLFRKNHKVLLWGHGPGYLTRSSWLRKKLESFMANRADKVLLYTEPGMRRLSDLGVDPKRLDYLNNTFDWDSVSNALDNLSQAEIGAFKAKYELPQGKVLAFIGALDESKRIGFLCKVLDHLWESESPIRFLVAGEGPEGIFLSRAVQRGQVFLLGRIDAKGKALVSTASVGLVNPGNIGLLAVDALTLGIPIFGTSVRSSPEKDYLVEGESLFTLPNNPKDFALLLDAFCQDPKRGPYARQAPSLEDFAGRYVKNLISSAVPSKPKILFLTNLPAPYRISLFTEIAEHFDLTIGFSGWRNEGRDWLLPQEPNLRFKTKNVGLLLGLGKFRLPFPKPGLARLCGESDLVIAGGWDSPVYMWSLIFAKRKNTLAAMWFESTLKSAHFRRGVVDILRRAVFKIPDFVITPGNAASEAALHYSERKLPILQLSNPVENKFLDSNNPHRSTVGTRFLYFGRLLAWKRVDLLIESFNAIAGPHDTLSIIGSGQENRKIRQLVEKSARKSQINIQPAVNPSDSIDVYKDHDVLVLPSNREVWGMVVPEALLMGLSVVVADSAGCLASFKGSPRVFAFETDSQESLSSALIASRTRVSKNWDQQGQLKSLTDSKKFAYELKKFYESINRNPHEITHRRR